MASSQEVVVELAQRAANGNVETTTKHTAVLRSTVTKLSRCLKCKILCSCEQTVILCMVAFSGIAHLYVFYLYSNQFTTFERDWLWIFPFLSALSLLLVLSFVVRILSAACCSQNVITKREVRPQRSLPYLLEVLRDVVKTIYLTLFDVNGKLFLVKLHLLELFENSFQMYNAVTLYTCSMPIEMMVVLSAIFIIELCIILWTSFHLDSQIYRDRQIMADMITDIFCMGFPLSYFFFAFNVPVHIETMAQLVGLPTLFLLSKANDVWEDVFKIDAQRIDANRVEIKRRSSKRNSIFQLAENIEVMQKQVNHFPNWLRTVFAICNVGFIAFYGAIIVVQLLSRPSNLQCNNIYTEDIWSKCSVELPFCQNFFLPTCDCGVMILRNYTNKTLPSSFGGLQSLLKLAIYEGKLEALSVSFGTNHPRLIVLILKGTQLQRLPDSIVELQSLIRLDVSMNRLTTLPEKTGKLSNLIYLNCAENNITFIPQSIGDMSDMIWLKMNGNRITHLPNSMGQLKRLTFLQVDNNPLTKLPATFRGLKNLRYIYAANNSLATLPLEIGNLNILRMADFRNNKLRTLPMSVSNFKMVQQFYLAGNPLCPEYTFPASLASAEGLCKAQCALHGCLDAWVGDGYCDDIDYMYEDIKMAEKHGDPTMPAQRGCNVKTCDFDGGDCPRP